ncbi:hypothetical protein D3C71_1646790 [compost metagenome]
MLTINLLFNEPTKAPALLPLENLFFVLVQLLNSAPESPDASIPAILYRLLFEVIVAEVTLQLFAVNFSAE